MDYKSVTGKCSKSNMKHNYCKTLSCSKSKAFKIGKYSKARLPKPSLKTVSDNVVIMNQMCLFVHFVLYQI